MRSASDDKRLIAVCCGLMFMYGCFMGAIQAVIESVAVSLGMDTAGMGSLVAVMHLPTIFLPVLMGAVADRIGRKPVIAGACAVFAVGLIVCGSSTTAGIYILGALGIGAGYSVCESGGCAAMSDIGPEAALKGINLSQALLCLGAVITPAAIQMANLSWRTVLYLCAAGFVVMLPLVLLVRFPKIAHAAPKQGDAGGFRALFASRAFVLLLVSILLYVGMESGFGYFIESMISRKYASTVLPCVSLYWLGMMLSRFLFSSFHYRSRPVLVGCFWADVLILGGIVVSSNQYLSLALCFLNGFAFGPIWSTLMAEATVRHPAHAGAVSGLMSTGCGAGGIVFPLLTGLAAQHFSLAASFMMLAVLAAAGGALCAILPERREP